MNNIYESLPQNASLRRVTGKEIMVLRASRKKTIVVKIGEDLYVMRLPKMNVESVHGVQYLLGKHKCSTCTMECGSRMCQKVSDPMLTPVEREGEHGWINLKYSKRIEKYPFIKKGIEYFNGPKEYFVVAECENYTKENDGQKKEDRNSAMMQGEYANRKYAQMRNGFLKNGMRA